MDLLEASSSSRIEAECSSSSSSTTPNGNFEQVPAIVSAYEIRDVDLIYCELCKLTKGDASAEAINNKMLAQFLERHAVLRSEVARAVKLLMKIAAESKVGPNNAETEKKIMNLLKEKKPEWMHLYDFLNRGFSARFPKSYLSL